MGLFAARLDGGDPGEVGGNGVGCEGFDIHLDEGDKRTAEIGEGPAAAVHDGAGGHGDAAMITHDLDGFLDAPPRVTTSSATRNFRRV